VNASLHPEVLHRRESSPQADLPLCADGVLRHLWESRFGPILIEVRDDQIYVNGQLVEAATFGRNAPLGPLAPRS